MNKLSCAAMLLALCFSGSVSADGMGAQVNRADASRLLYWRCVYIADSGMYEFEQRSRCALSLDHPVYGHMTLFEAYPV